MPEQTREAIDAYMKETSKKPGDCQDSYWLTATFAASAVNINAGTNTPTCNP